MVRFTCLCTDLCRLSGHRVMILSYADDLSTADLQVLQIPKISAIFLQINSQMCFYAPHSLPQSSSSHSIPQSASQSSSRPQSLQSKSC